MSKYNVKGWIKVLNKAIAIIVDERELCDQEDCGTQPCKYCREKTKAIAGLQKVIVEASEKVA